MAVTKSKDSVFDMIKLGLILVCYAVASCAVLAVVNNFTSAKITQNKIQKANEAMKVVYADADEYVSVTDFTPSEDPTISISDVYMVMKNGAVAGGIAQVAGPTYDKAKIILGITTDGKITGMRFLELTDSPGFGLKANDPSFYDQFAGKSAKTPFVAGETYDAISGATITSNGVVKLISEGSNSLLKYFGEHHYE